MALSFRNVEIEQQIARGFDTVAVERLLNHWGNVEKYAYIIHDSDVKPDGAPVEPHIHLMLGFKTPYPLQTLVNASRAMLGDVLNPQNFQKCHRWTSAIAYLTHENAPEKHQYPRENVVANFPIG